MPSVPSWRVLTKYPVISGTALLAIGVTIAWWTGTSISPLLDSAEIRRGQIWRLATSAFPHINFLHLAFNVYWLWVFGTAVERAFGHLRPAAWLCHRAPRTTPINRRCRRSLGSCRAFRSDLCEAAGQLFQVWWIRGIKMGIRRLDRKSRCESRPLVHHRCCKVSAEGCAILVQSRNCTPAIEPSTSRFVRL